MRRITVMVHPTFYNKMEEMRKRYQQKNINLSQVEITNILAARMSKLIEPKLNKIDLIGGNNVKKFIKKR